MLRSRQSIEAVLGQVGEKAQQQMQALASRRLDDCQRSMYLDAVPKQEPIDPLKKNPLGKMVSTESPLSKILLATFLCRPFYSKNFDPARRFSVTFEAVRRFFFIRFLQSRKA